MTIDTVWIARDYCTLSTNTKTPHISTNLCFVETKGAKTFNWILNLFCSWCYNWHYNSLDKTTIHSLDKVENQSSNWSVIRYLNTNEKITCLIMVINSFELVIQSMQFYSKLARNYRKQGAKLAVRIIYNGYEIKYPTVAVVLEWAEEHFKISSKPSDVVNRLVRKLYNSGRNITALTIGLPMFSLWH